MTKVLTVGVFDFFHLGHLRVLEQAKAYGDYLVVAVQEESFIRKYKPDVDIWFSTEERIEVVEALDIVDEVITYKDVDTVVKEVDFDVFAVGEDQTHEGFQRAEKYCLESGKRVVRLKRTEGICSSEMKQKCFENGL